MGIAGSNLTDTNFRLRFFVLVFMGIVAIASVVYWRSTTLTAASYVDFPNHLSQHQAESNKLHSKNFQIDVEDSSPTVK